MEAIAVPSYRKARGADSEKEGFVAGPVVLLAFRG